MERKKVTLGILSFVMLILCLSCTNGTKEGEYLFRPVRAETSGIHFSNDLPLDDDLNILNYIYYFNGGGVAVGDINNDGRDDLFFTGNQVSNRLYLNQGGMGFRDVTKEAGLESTGWSTGAVMVDINTDGWLDIYVCRSGHMDPELRKNLLYINQSDGTFREMAREYGLADPSYSTQSAFFDYDLDGDLDMYLLNHMHQTTGMNNPVPRKLNGESESTDKLYRNDGTGPLGHPVFTDVSREAGITIEGFGLGVGVSDLDQDGYPDIYISNDFISNDILYINQGDGTFADRSKELIAHQSHNGMGNDIADINNDGLADILVLDMLPSDNRRRKLMLNKPNHNLFEFSKSLGYQPQYMRNTFQLNNGGEAPFSEVGQLMGISATDWSWGGLLADFDRDGKKDMFITTGYLKDMTDLDFIVYRRKQFRFRTREEADSIYLASINRLPEVALQNYFYRNKGGLEFGDTSRTWAPESPGFSNGAVYADLDNDGDLDIVTNNINGKAGVLENMSAQAKNGKAHFLKLNFKGPQGNPNGIGVKVWAYAGGSLQFSENYTSRGFQSCVASNAYFAFGDHQGPDSLVVVWPDGKRASYDNPPMDTTLTLDHSNVSEMPLPFGNAERERPLARVPGIIPYKHAEIPFSDFDIEPLIPQKFSRNGPSLAVADADGDGLDDIYIGGSHGFPGRLFIQDDRTGRFMAYTLAMDVEHEDTGSLWFDADNDGDNDLYVVSGGSEFSLMKPGYYQDRLYINDGEGNLTLSDDALPTINTSGSCVVASDYDQDGDLDLFVGGMVVPGSYGLAPKSHFLENNGGRFTDVTRELLGEQALGMVTAALWTDADNDDRMDLMVVGKWMPITFYLQRDGSFEKVVLPDSSGWWNSINGGDFDNDGDVDYIIGNQGLNSVYHASKDHPLELYVGDFDRDGKIDPLISQYARSVDGSMESYPMASRDLLAEQMFSIKGKYKYYRSYADAQIGDILSDSMEDHTVKREVQQLESVFVENLGGHGFQIKALPREAQWAPILGSTVVDLDGDGNLDVVLTGNFYDYEVGYGQNDAFLGLVLKGDGTGNFSPMDHGDSGFLVPGNSRALTRAMGTGGELLVSSINGDSLITHRTKNDMKDMVKVPVQVRSGIMVLENGKRRKMEFYDGEGYLSQSTRNIVLPRNAIIEFNNKQE